MSNARVGARPRNPVGSPPHDPAMSRLRYAVHAGGVLLGMLAALAVLLVTAVATVFGLGDEQTRLRGFALGASLWLGAMVYGVLMNG